MKEKERILKETLSYFSNSITLGARSISRDYYKDCQRQNMCPCQAYSEYDKPMCAAWGSGTPMVLFNRKCTFEDVLKCPILDHYPDQILFQRWSKWLRKREII